MSKPRGSPGAFGSRLQSREGFRQTLNPVSNSVKGSLYHEVFQNTPPPSFIVKNLKILLNLKIFPVKQGIGDVKIIL